MIWAHWREELGIDVEVQVEDGVVIYAEEDSSDKLNFGLQEQVCMRISTSLRGYGPAGTYFSRRQWRFLGSQVPRLSGVWSGFIAR